MFELVKITENNIAFYDNFDLIFEKELNQYQSRIYPSKDMEMTFWYYIKADDKIIGSVWLEKEKNKSYAVLGIFIAFQIYRSKGIGTWAIRRIIEQNAADMNVTEIRLNVRKTNLRAYRCYSSLGFHEQNRYVKPTGVEVISMSVPVDKILQVKNTI